MFLNIDIEPIIDLSDLVNQFTSLQSIDVKAFIQESTVIYRNEFSLINLESKYLVLERVGKYYLAHLSNKSEKIEPLLIQVTNDGKIFDYFLEEFLATIKHEKLIDCFISVVDYSRLLDLLRDIE